MQAHCLLQKRICRSCNLIRCAPKQSWHCETNSAVIQNIDGGKVGYGHAVSEMIAHTCAIDYLQLHAALSADVHWAGLIAGWPICFSFSFKAS